MLKFSEKKSESVILSDLAHISTIHFKLEVDQIEHQTLFYNTHIPCTCTFHSYSYTKETICKEISYIIFAHKVIYIQEIKYIFENGTIFLSKLFKQFQSFQNLKK